MNQVIATVSKFEDIKSQYLRKWINILCNTEARYSEFVDKFLDNNNIFYSVSEYQRYLRAKGEGNKVDIVDMQKAVDIGDVITLNYMFEDLFMEPIDREAVSHFMSLAKQEKLKLTDIIDYHKKDQDRGFWLTIKKVM